MFRAYFVDDEHLVLDEFSSNPLFREHGYRLIGKHTNPLEAVNEIKDLNPDVVFTDLRMSVCSGIDMIEKLRKKGVECEFIVISAYPEFEESRRFFLLDGFDYLLKPVSDENLSMLLNRLAGKLAGKGSGFEKFKDTSSPELNKIVAYLKENLTGKHSLETLAKKFYMNPSCVCRLFANYLGTTFTAYLTMLRMDEAARLLKETQKDIKEISVLCGYKDYFYFCRVFRQHHSCTPTVFREGFK